MEPLVTQIDKLRGWLLSWPRLIKRVVVMSVDILTASFSVWLSYYLRVGNVVNLFNYYDEHNPLLAIVFCCLIAAPVFMYFGLYRIIFRYAGSSALFSVTKAFLVYSALFCFCVTIIGIDGVPRTIGIIQPIVFFILVLILRLIARSWLGEAYEHILSKVGLPKVLIFGAGQTGQDLATALTRSKEFYVAGFIDEDVNLQGSHIQGKIVISPLLVKKFVENQNIEQVLIAIPRIRERRVNEIISLLKGSSVVVKRVPSAAEMSNGGTNINQVRELTVDEILGRESVKPDNNLLQQDILGKTVLVTGAGGSIGSELCRQILIQRPNKLILFDHSEFLLFEIFEELLQIMSSLDFDVEIEQILASITDKQKVDFFFHKYKPDSVYHAAAYKHVYMVEKNSLTGVENNVFGTLFCAQAALKNNVSKFVLVSSDKAVRPTSVMGATKRISEIILQSFAAEQQFTKFAIVRFGNVLNSSGSVVPIFRKQIKNGGPLFVTHKDVVRYFMTIEEAATLIIQAGSLTNSKNESIDFSPVYLLDMGAPVKIYDLAVKMIELSGQKVKSDSENGVEIVITNLKQGEKLFEELLIDGAEEKTDCPKIFYARERFPEKKQVKKIISEMELLIKEGKHIELAQFVKAVAISNDYVVVCQ